MVKEKDPLIMLTEAMIVGPSQMIENQEARGQSAFVNSSVLPKKMNCPQGILEGFGVIFENDTDDLFVNVILPVGWEKKATDHSMHSDLFDESGRKRATIFYKAAFYDRSASLSVLCRYTISRYESCESDGNPVSRYDAGDHMSTHVLDCGKSIKMIAVRPREESWDDGDRHYEEARKWLTKNYPDYKNPSAYW